MDKQKRFTRPLLLAIALHLSLLGLFALSALYKPKPIEPKPVPEIIHATIIDTASLQAEADAVKQANAAKKEATKEKSDAVEAKEKVEAAEQAKLKARESRSKQGESGGCLSSQSRSRQRGKSRSGSSSQGRSG